MDMCAMPGASSLWINRASMYSAEPFIRGWRAALRARNDFRRSILGSIN
jgi:hypothetical protein